MAKKKQPEPVIEQTPRAAVASANPKKINDLSIGDVVKLNCRVEGLTKSANATVIQFVINGVPVNVPYPSAGDPGFAEVVTE